MKAQDALHNYYRTKSFVCNYTPLHRFVDVISEAYGADIRIVSPKLYNLPLTATFRQASLNEILDVLTATFPQVQIERKDGQILLK
jgi:ferric-dicitrate binding protein FerR (iron transport regulator)